MHTYVPLIISMQKIFTYLFIVVFVSFLSINTPSAKPEQPSVNAPVVSEAEMLYNEMQLENIVDYKAFEQAFTGYNKLDVQNKSILTVIDFSKPSTEERMCVIDMKHKKLLFSTHVAHGRNSGGNYATSFSNKNGSYKSSLGFYVTENTYTGKNGYSLVLDGLEKGINDKAKERAIVIHGADYANPRNIPSSGRLGRSLGCPALPRAVNKIIINTIKGGTLLYIYADNKSYMAQSNIISESHIASM